MHGRTQDRIETDSGKRPDQLRRRDKRRPMSHIHHTHIPGITIHRKPEAIHVQSHELLTVLSSSFFGGGFRRVRHILNANVAEDYCSNDPAGDLREIAGRCGVHESFIGLLTAVPLHKARIVFAEDRGCLCAGALVTAGVGNATRAGVSPPCRSEPGTINIILLLDANLTRAAMVNAMITATEAKCAVLNEMDIRTPEGELATGTSTDTVTVATTGHGTAHAYAGPATVLGWLIARAVRQSIRESLLAE
jgi:iron complex transport system ATP-binding protein